MLKLLYNRENNPVYLENIYNGATAFYIGGGPSLNNLDLSNLSQRGILTFAVNNIAARNIKPNIWCSTDDPVSFSKVIWRDPSVLKLVVAENFGKEYAGGKVKDSPNTLYFTTNRDFDPKRYLTEDSVNFGNYKGKVDSLGISGHRSVMYCSIRLMYYLGIRRIFLLGCDFKMTKEQPYAFEQVKWAGGVASNNEGYNRMNKRFTALQPLFLTAGLQIFNCCPFSSLTAFPHYDFSRAIESTVLPIVQEGDLKTMYIGSLDG